MDTLYTFFALVASTFLLVSFSTNPPDGKTGAPGDGFCIECHSHSNTLLDGTISVEGFPVIINPLETYVLTVVNRNTAGDAVRGGFQMTILGPFNTKAGTMANPSASSIVANSGGRQYFEHHPAVEYPDTNVVRWTVEWTAPELAGGSEITYYVAGNIADGNFQNTNDRVVSASGKGDILLSDTEELFLEKPTLYPNPGSDQINVVLANHTSPDGQGVFFNLMGALVGKAEIVQGRMITPDLPVGIYLIEIKQKDNSQFVKWSKM